MNTETHSQYIARAVEACGKDDPWKLLAWAYEHPAGKPLPKGKGVRDWHFYVERRIGLCLNAIAGAGHTDGLANAILRQWIADHEPELWTMFERHEQEIEQRLAELRRNEPDIEPDTIRAGSIEHDDCGSR